MNKTDVQLVRESIAHWERMVESCKWLVESGFNIEIKYKLEIKNIFLFHLGESPFSNSCPLCKKYISGSCHTPCDSNNSPWRKTMCTFDSFQTFIHAAEGHMIPGLYQSLMYCKGE